MATTRPATPGRLQSEARKLLREFIREDQASLDARASADDALIALQTIHSRLEKRFKREIPFDALLFDVLELIDVEKGDKWRWNGGRNNIGTPTIRIDRGEKSLGRYLALAFGVIKEDQQGTMYPAYGDPEDMNPYHRVLRESDVVVGHLNRYAVPHLDGR